MKKFGIKAEYLIPQDQLKQITGGRVDLNCRCEGSVGCWYYPSSTVDDVDGPTVSADISQYCASGVGRCTDRVDFCATA